MTVGLLMGNLGWQDWSEFGKVGVTMASEDTSSLTIDRNYKDTWHVAFGAQYRVADPWLLTAGVAYDSSMVDDEDRTPDLPMGKRPGASGWVPATTGPKNWLLVWGTRFFGARIWTWTLTGGLWREGFRVRMRTRQ